MRLIFFIIVFCCINYSYSQIDSKKMDLIGKYLNLEKFEDKNTFYIDEVVKLNEYSFYSVTPFTSSYSFCVIFKNNTIIEVENFPNSMNRIPYQFKSYYSEDGSIYITTYWYSDSVSSSSIVYYILKLNDELKVVFNDYLYLNIKDEKNEKVNDFLISTTDRCEFLLTKTINGVNKLNSLIDKFDLAIDYVKKRKHTQIKSICLDNLGSGTD